MTQSVINNLNLLDSITDKYKGFGTDKESLQNMTIPEIFQGIYNKKTDLIKNNSQLDKIEENVNQTTQTNEISKTSTSLKEDRAEEAETNPAQEQMLYNNQTINEQVLNQNTTNNDTESTITENEIDITDVSIDINTDITVENINTTIENIDTEITKPTQNTDTKTNEEYDFLADEDALKELNIEAIEAETTSQDNDSSLLNKENIDEHVIKITLNNDSQNFETHLNEVEQTTQNNAVQNENPSKIIEQVTKQLEGLKYNSKVDIVLNPENLGKVNIQLVKNSAGLSAQFSVDSDETKTLLQNNLDGLKNKLTSLGVGVDNISVKLSDNQDTGKYQKDWTEQEGSQQQNPQQQKQQKENSAKNFEELIAFSQQENKD